MLRPEKKQTKVLSIEFGKPPFRKLGELRLEFADRFTIIAGHNGIGKSTILGLLTNTFGLTDDESPRSYFGDQFFHNIEKIVYLGLDEVAKAQAEPLSSPVVVADFGGIIVRKRCALTRRIKYKRARVVPRTVDRADNDGVGPDAKVPLPTIFLGMRRLASIGEADESEVSSKKAVMHEDDKKLMVDIVKSVILGTQVNDEATQHAIRGSRKNTIQPGYDLHDALAVSMGQDSLGSIATALASFSKLKRDFGDDYQGGLLIIDELDVGFHPHAIGKLATVLKSYARKLDLQIIATTHSPALIECVHPDGDGNGNAPDKVIYLLDTKAPRLAEDQSLLAILSDMKLQVKTPAVRRIRKPALCVYFEDQEGEQFLNALLPATARRAIADPLGVRLQLIPLGVGGSNLLGLPDKDPIFRNRLLVVDADTSIPDKAAARGNAVKLPCMSAARGTARSPENTIRNFLYSIAIADDGVQRELCPKFNENNVSSDSILETFFQDGVGGNLVREASKKWWQAHWPHLRAWKVVEVWAEEHPVETERFVGAFRAAVAKTAPRVL